MEQLNTRIVLRNDSYTNWEANSGEVLLKGEAGIEFFDDGTAKIKLGDGVKTWEQLSYFGGTSGDSSEAIMLADGKSIVVTNGAVGLVGFAAATAGQVPRVNAAGSLEWYTPITPENIEDVTTQVNGLATTVAEQTTAIEALQTGKANTADVYTKTEVDALVNSSVIKDVVASKDDLTTVENPQVGDRVQVLGDQIYVYNGTEWEPYNLSAIDKVTVGGTVIDVVDKTVDIPAATAVALGVVKSSDVVNGVMVNADGTMEVASLSVDKLNQVEGTVLVLNGGTSSTISG